MTTDLFQKQSVEYMNMNIPRIEKCLALLDEQQAWWSPNNQSNSIGNLILHLCGNISQWVLAGLGGASDERERDLEFSARGGYSKAELLEKIKEVVHKAEAVILGMDDAGLKQSYRIQGFENSGYGVVIHIVEHFSYHTGQIALLTKLLENRDLGFYDGLELNTKVGE